MYTDNEFNIRNVLVDSHFDSMFFRLLEIEKNAIGTTCGLILRVKCTAIQIHFDNKTKTLLWKAYFVVNFFVKWITVTCFPPKFVIWSMNRMTTGIDRGKDTYKHIYRFYLMVFWRRMDNVAQNNGTHLNRITYTRTSNFLSIGYVVAFFSLSSVPYPSFRTLTHVSIATHFLYLSGLKYLFP